MQNGNAGHVTSAEWRWVTLASIALVLIAFLPFFWVLIIGLADSDWQFMGVLHHHQDGATYLARVYQGTERHFLAQFLHSPESQDGTLIGLIYILIGQISRFVAMSPVALFHATRVGASIFMYMALYQLAATIWVRIRTRRIFFVLITAGSGVGWLAAPLFEVLDVPDLTIPQIYPFFSTLASVHYPLSIAFIALLVGIVIVIFRPGNAELPSVENGGVIAFLGGLVLALMTPLAFLPIILTLFLGLALIRRQRRERLTSRFWWLLWFITPALPILVYYVALLRYNEIVSKIWDQMSENTPPAFWVLLLGLGGILVIALPGLYRAIRRFEPDGDQVMLVWLVLILILIYLPIGGGMEFATGLMIPVAYFATRSIEEFWFDYIPRRWRIRLMVIVLPIIAMSHVLILVVPLRPVANGNFAQAEGILLERSYFEVFSWLRSRTNNNTVILAAPKAGLWIPVWTGAKTVYGHPVDTVDVDVKYRAVVDFFRTDDLNKCQSVLDGSFNYNGDYHVSYVIMGPLERKLGDTVCTELLTPILQAQDVILYQYETDLPEAE